jgi:hypothetical protein
MCEKSPIQAFGPRRKSDWFVSPPDEVHPEWGGEMVGKISELLYAPSAEEIRSMLIALRQQQRWSQAFAAAVLGVTEGAVVKWEAGNRKPNGAAAKLIFFLHSQIVEKADKVRNAWDLATWGKVPCRNGLPLIQLCGTYWVSNDVMEEIMATPVERLRPEWVVENSKMTPVNEWGVYCRDKSGREHRLLDEGVNGNLVITADNRYVAAGSGGELLIWRLSDGKQIFRKRLAKESGFILYDAVDNLILWADTDGSELLGVRIRTQLP